MCGAVANKRMTFVIERLQIYTKTLFWGSGSYFQLEDREKREGEERNENTSEK